MDLVRHLVLEDPTTLWIALGIVAVIAGLWWRRTGRRAAAGLLIAALVLAVAAGLVARLVETDYEKVARTLGTISDAADEGLPDALIERISPDYRNGAAGFTKENLASAVRLGLDRLRASAERPTIRMQGGRATVTQAWTFRPAPGSVAARLPPQYERVVWEGEFAPDPDGEWRLRSATAIQPQRRTPEEAARFVPRLPR
jgi:hypothetical protein